METLNRLLLEEQSDLGLHCLPKPMYLIITVLGPSFPSQNQALQENKRCFIKGIFISNKTCFTDVFLNTIWNGQMYLVNAFNLSYINIFEM